MPKHEGRVQRRLRAMLEALGYTDVHLFQATGSHRTDTRMNCCRWTGHGYLDQARHLFQSWFTMTECVSSGSISINAEGDVTPKRAAA